MGAHHNKVTCLDIITLASAEAGGKAEVTAFERGETTMIFQVGESSTHDRPSFPKTSHIYRASNKVHPSIIKGTKSP